MQVGYGTTNGSHARLYLCSQIEEETIGLFDTDRCSQQETKDASESEFGPGMLDKRGQRNGTFAAMGMQISITFFLSFSKQSESRENGVVEIEKRCYTV
jgi:hypothetical protein